MLNWHIRSCAKCWLERTRLAALKHPVAGDRDDKEGVLVVSGDAGLLVNALAAAAANAWAPAVAPGTWLVAPVTFQRVVCVGGAL